MASAPSIPGATRSAVGLDRAVRARARRRAGTLGLCRGGMFTADAAHRIEARDDNRRAVDEAKALGAPCIVLVVGGLPQYSRREARPRRTSWPRARRCTTPSPRCWNTRKQPNMPLAIEPLHPAYAADRAREHDKAGAGYLRPARSAAHRRARRRARRLSHLVGSGIDAADRARRKDRLLAFHVCDWLVPTKDILNDRGMMGDGVIDITSVRSAVEAQGFAGYSEIEIFSNDWWNKAAWTRS